MKIRATAEELLALAEANKFAAEYVDKEFLDLVLRELPRRPVRYGADLAPSAAPEGALVICRSCRQLYEACYQADVFGRVMGRGVRVDGPFCYPCAYQIARDALRNQ